MASENEIVQVEDVEQETQSDRQDKPTGVELADETFLNADAGYADGSLWIWMRDPEDPDSNFVYLAGLFSDSSKTQAITYYGPGGTEQKWTGLTRLATISTDADGKFSIRMRKAE